MGTTYSTVEENSHTTVQYEYGTCTSLLDYGEHTVVETCVVYNIIRVQHEYYLILYDYRLGKPGARLICLRL
jgi:hypothetical protein